MDNNALGEVLAAQLLDRLQHLTPEAVTPVFVDYSLQLTISARACFIGGEFELAKKCNETVHRLLGYILKQLTVGAADQTQSMIAMVVADAAKNGWLLVLKAVLERLAEPA
jgi:hypothetical protein